VEVSIDKDVVIEPEKIKKWSPGMYKAYIELDPKYKKIGIDVADILEDGIKKILKGKKDYSLIFDILKVILLVVVIIFLLLAGFIYVSKNDILKKGIFETKKVEKTKKEKVVDSKMDYNYLFVGDFHTDGLEFEDFYKPYVKVSNSDYTTMDILDDEKDYIYVYNPTDVFIQLGYNDFKNETSIREVVENLEKIINGIKINRQYANVYVESIYPINDKIDGYEKDKEVINNDFIIDINNEIEAMCKRNNIKYINIYSELSDNDLLKEEYTDDGINLNSDGYKKVFKVINRYIK
jgi:lysophospholipase L1-like esterase